MLSSKWVSGMMPIEISIMHKASYRLADNIRRYLDEE